MEKSENLVFCIFQPILATLYSVKGKLGAKILPQAHGPIDL